MGGKVEKPQNMGKTIRRLMTYVKRYWPRLIIVLFCMLLTTVTSLCGGYLMAPIVDKIALAVNPGTKVEMSAFETIADGVITGICGPEAEVTAYVVAALVILGTVYGIGVITNYLQGRLMVQVSEGALEAIRNDLFRKMQKLPLKFFAMGILDLNKVVYSILLPDKNHIDAFSRNNWHI